MKKLIKEHINKKLPKGGFARSAAVLMASTTMAQGITFLISPILTRLYSPENFGHFAIFSAAVAVVTVFITLKYENAIMLPNDDIDAVNVVALSVIISILTSLIIFLIVVFFGSRLLMLFGHQVERDWLFLFPVVVFFMGIYIPFYNWLNRLGRYKTMAYRSITLAAVTGGLSLCFGFLGFKSLGLIASFVLGQILVVVILSYDIYITTRDKIKFISFTKMTNQMVRYVQFPVYDLSSSLVSLVVNQAPIFIYNKYFGANMVGSYSFTNKILGVPTNLISSSILCVFRQRATQDYNKNGNCIFIYKKTFKNLLLLSIVPFSIFIFFSPILFKLVFGSQWVLAGELAGIMSFMFFIRFITNPLAYMFYVAEKQRYDFFGQVLFLCSTATAVGLGIYYSSLRISIISMTIGHSFIYVLYLLVSFELAKGRWHRQAVCKGC